MRVLIKIKKKKKKKRRILMNFLCIYIGEKGGGGAVMHVYVWEHIVSLYYGTA